MRTLWLPSACRRYLRHKHRPLPPSGDSAADMSSLYAAYAGSSRSLAEAAEEAASEMEEEEPLTARPRHVRESSIVSRDSRASADLLDEIDRAIGEAIDDVHQLPDSSRFERRPKYDLRQSRDVPTDVLGDEEDDLSRLARTTSTDSQARPVDVNFSSPPALSLGLLDSPPPPIAIIETTPTARRDRDNDDMSVSSSLPSLSAYEPSTSPSNEYVEVMQDDIGRSNDGHDTEPYISADNSPFATRADSPVPFDGVAPAGTPVTPPGPASPLKAVNGTEPYTSPSPSPQTMRRQSMIPRSASVRSEPRTNGVARSPSVELAHLVRNRPLPHSCYFGDVTSLRGAGDRAMAYANKINELSKEESGLETWIAYVRRRGRGQPIPAPSRASSYPLCTLQGAQ